MKPLVGAYYYLWYTKDQWNSGHVHTPSLDLYESSKSDVTERHLDWAVEYGTDFFFIAWQGPNSVANLNLEKAFLPTLKSRQEGHKIKFAIFYEPWYNQAITKTKDERGRETINVTDPGNFRVLTEELNSAGRYFPEQDYLKIRGKPVLGIYKARDLTGNVQTFTDQVRRTLPTVPYLIGDRVWWREGRQRIWFNYREAVRPYDGVTAYNMHHNKKLEGFEKNIDAEYHAWSNALSKIDCDFIPGILPGYDDRNVVPPRGNKPLERSEDRFRQQVAIAGKYVSKNPMILITSFNEWHEDTQVEPDTSAYGTKYLEVVRNRSVV
jgi:glycoprotein endo-alpha-1,2-mannosidase